VLKWAARRNFSCFKSVLHWHGGHAPLCPPCG